MKVIATETGFYNKRRIYPGEVFEFAGEKCGKWFAPVDSVAAKGKDEVKNDDGPTRKEMMVQLDQAGVKYDKNMNKADLLELLKATVQSYLPGASAAGKDLREPTE